MTLKWGGGGLAEMSLNITWGEGFFKKCHVTKFIGNLLVLRLIQAFVMLHRQGRGSKTCRKSVMY